MIVMETITKTNKIANTASKHRNKPQHSLKQEIDFSDTLFRNISIVLFIGSIIIFSFSLVLSKSVDKKVNEFSNMFSEQNKEMENMLKDYERFSKKLPLSTTSSENNQEFNYAGEEILPNTVSQSSVIPTSIKFISENEKKKTIASDN